MDAIKEGMLASAKAAEAAARIGERLFCQNTPNVMKPKDNIIVQKCLMSCAFFKLMEKDGKASCTIWLDDTPTICDLYVNESDRRQGLATRMLKMCEDLVKAEGYPGVFLYTDEGSWLVDWYERKGYRKTGETLQIHGRTVTSVWLYKEF